MSNNLTLIGTGWITTPNFLGKVIKQTPKTVTFEVVEIDFTAKSSATLTHVFTEGEQEHFKSIVGRQMRFWKESGKEVGGNAFLKHPFK